VCYDGGDLTHFNSFDKNNMAEKDSEKETTKTKEKPKPKCGIIMPISPLDGYTTEHWAEVKEVLLEVISQTEFEGDLVSNANEIRVIHETIVQNIYFNEMVICDVSGKNPNVMFELGLRIAFDKPVIVIKDDDTNYSFDTSPIEHLPYPTDLNYRRINQFKKDLKAKIEATYADSKKGSPYLKSFGKFEVSGLETKTVPSDEYIIKSLNEIKSEISNLKSSRNSEIGNPKYNKNRGISKVSRLLTSVFITFPSEPDTTRGYEKLIDFLSDNVYISISIPNKKVELIFSTPTRDEIFEELAYVLRESGIPFTEIGGI
jgi:hypothetical protein